MTPEELAAIRERAYAQGIVRTMDYYAPKANRDRADLLAEVDRLTSTLKSIEEILCQPGLSERQRTKRVAQIMGWAK